MLEIKNISKIYGEGPAKVVALNNVSLRVNEGDFIAIMGPSGSGKSTLLNIIGGLDYPSRGEVILDGERIDNLGENDFVDTKKGGNCICLPRVSFAFISHRPRECNVTSNFLRSGERRGASTRDIKKGWIGREG